MSSSLAFMQVPALAPSLRVAPVVRRNSIVSVLVQRASATPDRLSHRFVARDLSVTDSLDYETLERWARAMGHACRNAGVDPGGRVLVVADTKPCALAGIFGALYAGAIAVPVPPLPSSIARVSEDCDASAILASAEYEPILRAACNPSRKFLALPPCDVAAGVAPLEVPAVAPNDVAILQYTSGSTSDPRGVMVTHRNLRHLLRLTERLQGYGPHTRVGSWLPLFHDLGLIGGALQPVFSGFTATLMSPLAFLSEPSAWLRLLSEIRATSTAAPNFALDLCVRRVSDAQRAELDLSALETLACAGEPVMADTLARFSELFAACGLRKRAIQPAYGLAEATLQAAIAPLAQGYVTVHADRAALERGELVTLRNERTDTITLTSSGRPVQHVEIVDPNTRRRCPAGIVGEIWVRSRAVTAGYWNRPGDSADVFGARVDDRETGHTYLRTGDMGVLHDGELFVTGRSKDLVIVRGENHWPQDIEATVLTAHAAVRPGGVAAFALTTTEGEALGVVAEIDERRAKSLENVIDAISVAIKRDHRLKPGVIALVPARAIPKTTSGKLRRRACRSAFLDGTLECLATAGARAH